MKLYLQSYDYEVFNKRAEIDSFEKIFIGDKKGLKVRLKKPLNGQMYDGYDLEIYTLYLVGRFGGLHHLEFFPFDVHVFIDRNKEKKDTPDFSDLYNIAWANLYRG